MIGWGKLAADKVCRLIDGLICCFRLKRMGRLDKLLLDETCCIGFKSLTVGLRSFNDARLFIRAKLVCFVNQAFSLGFNAVEFLAVELMIGFALRCAAAASSTATLMLSCRD